MLKVAIVGYGFMGKTHLAAWRKCRGAKVVAVCDVNLAQLTAKNLGNVPGADQTSVLGADVRVWENVDDMLAACGEARRSRGDRPTCGGTRRSRGDRPTCGIDVVDITLPTPLHASMVLKALAAGCHVLCEKPMALTLPECDRMLAAAKKAGKVFLVAQCVRFFPAYLKLAELVRGGRYGKVLAANFDRFMSIPKWSPKGASWLLDESKSGGLYIDAHIHDSDYIASLFGLPKRVSSHATRNERGFTLHTTTFYDYGDGKLVTSDCSYAATDALMFDASAKVFLEKATIYLGGKGEAPLRVYPEGGKPFSPKLATASGYEAEIAYFHKLVMGSETGRDALPRVRGRGESPRAILTAEDARTALKLVLAECKSDKLGRPVAIK